MAAQSISHDSIPLTEESSSVAEGKPGERRGFVQRCAPYFPAITILLAILGSLGTMMKELTDIRATQMQAQTENWLNALQKVSFDEPGLITTALLMKNFDADKDHADRAEQARRVERIVLEETERPSTFDVVVADMLSDTKKPEVVQQRLQELTEVVQRLDTRLADLHAAAEKNGTRQAPFNAFLADPASFYEGSAGRDGLKRALVTIWELDSISEQMTSALKKYPVVLTPEEPVTFLNHFPEGQKAVNHWTSCAVLKEDSGAGLTCGT